MAAYLLLLVSVHIVFQVFIDFDQVNHVFNLFVHGVVAALMRFRMPPHALDLWLGKAWRHNSSFSFIDLVDNSRLLDHRGSVTSSFEAVADSLFKFKQGVVGLTDKRRYRVFVHAGWSSMVVVPVPHDYVPFQLALSHILIRVLYRLNSAFFVHFRGMASLLGVHRVGLLGELAK